MCCKKFEEYHQMVCDIVVNVIKELEIADQAAENTFNSWELIKYLRGLEDQDGEVKQKEAFCFNHMYETILEQTTNGGNILEIGSGNGLLSAVISENKDTHVLGIDVNEASVYISKKLKEHLNRPNLEFTCCDISTLTGVSGSFDCIICIDIVGNFLEYKTETELDEYVSFMCSFLKPHGKILIFDYKKIISILQKNYMIEELNSTDHDKSLFSCVLKK